MLKTDSGRGYRLLGSWTPRHQDSTSAPVAFPRMREPGAAPANNLPMAITRLIGRSVAAQHVRELVSAYRLVTLTGPGGIGKTSLALDVARGILADFDDGGWFVELASLSDPGLVPGAVARVLGLKLSGDVISAEAVARAIGGQNVLLILDNCEHVIDAVAELSETVARLCPRTTVVATSRELLRVAGEHVYRVASLETPAVEATEQDHILSHSGVELFIARIKALELDLLSHPEDLTLIAAICRHLDGIPLAIEFATARAATLGIRQVAMGLSDRFALLTGGCRTAPPRHRTLRATFDWSYELLPEAERLLLRRLAVFPAGFTMEAAAAVMQDIGLDASVITDGIANLVAKSLVAADKPNTPRWVLLETVRAYALEKLAEHDDANTVGQSTHSCGLHLYGPTARVTTRQAG